MPQSFDNVAGLLEQWGRERKITTNGTIAGQLTKGIEEANEGLRTIAALEAGEIDQATFDERIEDDLGDFGVTFLMACFAAGKDPVAMLYVAHDEIKDRTGELGADGIFYKDA